MPIQTHGFLLCISILCSYSLGPTRSGVNSIKHRRPSFCDANTVQGKTDDDQDTTVGTLTGSSSGSSSFLWSTRLDPPSYFFGTIHVPYTRVWDHVPENAKQAFGNADNVVFELDLMDPATISALASCQMLPQGRSLADVLPRDLFERLKRHLDYVKVKMSSWMTADQRGQGLYADYLFNAITGDWERKRPIWVMLMVNSLTESDVKSRGIPVLDLYLAQEAERLSKRTGAVEGVQEQCLPLNGLNFSQVLFALDQTLRQHERIRRGVQRASYSADDLIRHYNCGDLDAVVFSRDSAQVPRLANASLRLSARELRLARDIDRYFRQELIHKRNHRMGDRVLRLLRAHPGQSFFFAFGAGHFLGNNTVLDFVRQGGFDIEHIVATRKIQNLRKTTDHRSGSWTTDRADGHNVLEEQGRMSSTGGGDPHDSDEEVSPATSGGARRGPGWQRRNSKRPQLARAPGVFLARTTALSPTSRPRKFNDLWVRLDGYATGRPSLSSLPQHGPTAAQDVLAIQQSLKLWYGYPNSGTSPRLLAAHVTLFSLLLCLFYTGAVLCEHMVIDDFPP